MKLYSPQSRFSHLCGITRAQIAVGGSGRKLWGFQGLGIRLLADSWPRDPVYCTQTPA